MAWCLAITWNNVDLTSMAFCGIHLRAISQELMSLIRNMCSDITLLKSLSPLPGANESIHCLPIPFAAALWPNHKEGLFILRSEPGCKIVQATLNVSSPDNWVVVATGGEFIHSKTLWCL